MSKSKTLIIIPVLAILLFSFAGIMLESCKHDSNIINDLPEVCFEAQILPIFQTSCALSGCHDASSRESGLVLDSYDNIVKHVQAGDPYKSRIYKSITDIWSDEMMPPGQSLSLESRTLIRVWIEQGAMNTICPDTIPPDTITNPEDTATWVNPRACFDRDILPIFVSSCAISGCHDAANPQDGIILTDYMKIRSRVTPGNPEESDIYEKITEDNALDIMPPPPYDPLPQAQIDSIYKWILYGALDEYCGIACDTSSEMTFSGYVWPIIEVSCRSCHTGSSPNGGVLLDSYANIAAVAADGRLKAVLNGDGIPLMPPGVGLSGCKVRQIEIWIENGYQNN